MAVAVVAGDHRRATRHLDPEGDDLIPEQGHDPADGTSEGERFLPDGRIPVHGLRERHGAQRALEDPGQDPHRRPSGRHLADPQVLAAWGLHCLEAAFEVPLLDSLTAGETRGGPAPAATFIPGDPPRRTQDLLDLIRLGFRNPGAVDHEPAGGAVRADRFRGQPLPVETFGDGRLEPPSRDLRPSRRESPRTRPRSAVPVRSLVGQVAVRGGRRQAAHRQDAARTVADGDGPPRVEQVEEMGSPETLLVARQHQSALDQPCPFSDRLVEITVQDGGVRLLERVPRRLAARRRAAPSGSPPRVSIRGRRRHPRPADTSRAARARR